jgi:hypothetical protein
LVAAVIYLRLSYRSQTTTANWGKNELGSRYDQFVLPLPWTSQKQNFNRKGAESAKKKETSALSAPLRLKFLFFV